jgi:mannosyl-3-phosphoglycerate phosphatase
MTRKIVFTDLDGTLINSNTYDHTASISVIRELQRQKIPIIFCSAKTRFELQVYRRKLGVYEPFIVENGGVLVIPNNYFSFNINQGRKSDEHIFIELGIENGVIRQRLKEILDSLRVRYHIFTQMSANDIARDSGMPVYQARLARKREYSETIKFDENPKTVEKTIEVIRSNGLNITFGGRYYVASGHNTKGTAVRVLVDLFRRSFDHITTYAFGNEENDTSMFQEVDVPILVEKNDGEWADIKIDRLRKVEGIGPLGVQKGVKELIGIDIKDRV